MTAGQKLLAFALPPLWIPLFFLAMVPSFRADPVLADMSTGEMALIHIVLGLLVGYGAMLVFGLPLHLLLKRRGWQTLAAYATAGFFTGAVLRALAIGLIWLDYGLALNGPGAKIVAEELTQKPIVLLTAGLAGMLVFSSFRMLMRGRTAALVRHIPQEQRRMGVRVEILCRDVVIGHAELDRLDPPMGVAEGAFAPSRHYDPRLHAYMIDCKDNDLTGQAPLVARSEAWGVIECLGTHVEDFNESLKEMNVSILGIPYPQYSDMFAFHPHYKTYYST